MQLSCSLITLQQLQHAPTVIVARHARLQFDPFGTVVAHHKARATRPYTAALSRLIAQTCGFSSEVVRRERRFSLCRGVGIRGRADDGKGWRVGASGCQRRCRPGPAEKGCYPMGLIITLLILWLVLVVIGSAIKTLFWLAIIGIVFFVATGIFGLIRGRGRGSTLH